MKEKLGNFFYIIPPLYFRKRVEGGDTEESEEGEKKKKKLSDCEERHLLTEEEQTIKRLDAFRKSLYPPCKEEVRESGFVELYSFLNLHSQVNIINYMRDVCGYRVDGSKGGEDPTIRKFFSQCLNKAKEVSDLPTSLTVGSVNPTKIQNDSVVNALSHDKLDPPGNNTVSAPPDPLIEKNNVVSSLISDSTRGDRLRRSVLFLQLGRLSREDRFRQSVVFRQLDRLSSRSREEISGCERDVSDYSMELADKGNNRQDYECDEVTSVTEKGGSEKEDGVDNEVIRVSEHTVAPVPGPCVKMIEVTDKLGSQTELTVTPAPRSIDEGRVTDLELDTSAGTGSSILW